MNIVLSKLKQYFKQRLGHWFCATFFVVLAFLGTAGTLACFGELWNNADKYQNTAFEFDVKENATAGLTLTGITIVLTMIDYILLETNTGVCVTPLTIACGSLAVFSGVALYLALSSELVVRLLVISQALAVGVQFGAIANVGRFDSNGEASADFGL